MQFYCLRDSNKLLNRKCPIILLLILQVNFSGFHFILIMSCDCPSQVFEFCLHFKILVTLLYIVPFLAPSQICENLCHIWLPSVRPTARREYLSSQWTDFHEKQFLGIFRKPAKIIKVSIKLTKLMDTLYKNLCMLMETSRWIFRRTRNVSGNVQNNQNTLYSITFFPKSCRCKVMWKNTI